jgi:predicted GIY-YIG superfamily endonuclease
MRVFIAGRPLIAMVSLLTHLRDFRVERAAGQMIPIFCVFGDTVLNAIASNRPNSTQALMRIRGMSEEKCRLYGDDILRIVSSHREPEPKARGMKLLREPAPTPGFLKLSRAVEPATGDEDTVYILELLHGRVYVGRTKNPRRRLAEHASGKGSAFTKAFPPTGVLLPRLGRVRGSGEAAERDETLRYMYLRGTSSVRGWKYTRVELTPEDVADAEANIRELFDLCRRCGHPGHFVGQCRNNYDRAGRPLG